MALFYLLTLYCVIRGAASAHAWRWYAAAIIACALGMLSKPVMVTAPITVLLYDRVFLAGSWGRAWRERRALYVGLAATWILPALLLAGHHESAGTAGFAMRNLTVLDYARSQPGVILHYLRLAFWPRGLVLDYAWPVANGVGAVAFPALVLAGLGSLGLWTFRRQPELGFLGATIFLILAPSSSLIPIEDLAFEHRMYLPLAALVALVIVCGQLLLRRAALGVRSERRVAAGLIAAVVVTLTILTVARNRDYSSAITMWTDVTVKRPENARARNNLGDALFQDGQLEEAIAQLRAALRLDPDYAQAHNNLGVALMRQERSDEAMAHYAQALRLKPDYAEASSNLGNALALQGKLADAVPQYVQALRSDPDYAEVHYNLALALAAQGKRDEARAHVATALRLRPDLEEVYRRSGLLEAR